MVTEIKSKPYYTRDRLISKCQNAIDEYGISVKLVYVYLDNNHTIGHKYQPPQKIPRAWSRLESGIASTYVDCDENNLQAIFDRVLELLRWLVFSNPNATANLAECATSLFDMSNMATQPPLRTREGKRLFICADNGTPFVFFDSKEPIDDLVKKVIVNTTRDDDALKHFEKYPNCQWTMVIDDVFGAIQMAARDHVLTNEVSDICSNVVKNIGEMAKQVSRQDKPKDLDDGVSFTLTEKERRVFAVLYEADNEDELTSKVIIERTEKGADNWAEGRDENKKDTVGKTVVFGLLNKLIDHEPNFAVREKPRGGAKLTPEGREYWRNRARDY